MPTSDLKIAAAYIRVSTDDQEEYSPDSQVRLIREYARKNGYLLPEEYVFQDDGISAATARKRPAFNRMIALAKEKVRPFDAILVLMFSRFARNREERAVQGSAAQTGHFRDLRQGARRGRPLRHADRKHHRVV